MKLSFGWKRTAPYLTSGLISGRALASDILKEIFIHGLNCQWYSETLANYKVPCTVPQLILSSLLWDLCPNYIELFEPSSISQTFIFHTCYFFYLNLANQALFYISVSNIFTKNIKLAYRYVKNTRSIYLVETEITSTIRYLCKKTQWDIWWGQC